MKKSLSYLIIFLLILVAIDFGVLSIWQSGQQQPGDGMTIMFIIIPFIIVVNIFLALVCYLLKFKFFAKALLINTLFLPVIYLSVSKEFYKHYMKTNFDRYRFENKNKIFEIELEKSNHFYTLSDVTNQSQGFSDSFLGDYKMSGDSIILIDSMGKKIIIKDKLIGYPTSIDTITLIRQSD